jgi:hypothetical protein
MAKRNYRNSLPWKEVENLLLALREKAFLESIKADDVQAVRMCQGEARAYNKLLTLPELLEMRDMELEDLNEER